MKMALLHYWLTNMRGGENVFREICRMFPDGDVFTHAYRPDRVSCLSSHAIHESFIARLPFGRRWPQAYLPLMPMASRSFKLDGYDLIISSESGPIKGIRKPQGAKHICYCHTPMRYLWDMYEEYYQMAGLSGKIAMRTFRDYLRKEDLKSADSVDVFVANSKFVADRIKRIYGRDATVVYPMVDYEYFRLRSEVEVDDGEYYLLAGQLISYKRPDLAVAACLKMGRKLKVIGVGNQIEKLKALAAGNTNVEFLGRVSNEALRDAYANAKALIFPGVEDFGIVPLEAQAAGTPVIAYGVGGALETVVKDSTGLFFDEQTVESLCGAIEQFESRNWSADACCSQAKRFAPEVFRHALSKVIEHAIG